MKYFIIFILFASVHSTKIQIPGYSSESGSEILETLPELPACSGFDDVIFRKIWNQHRNETSAENVTDQSKSNNI